MVGRTNAGGGASGSAFAAIGVTYPAGSSCTCTNGTKTLKAKDTGGSFLFLIPEAGRWTVSCTDGKNSKSRTLDITEKWQTENVVLNYELVLFDSGMVIPMSKGYANAPTSGAPVVTIDSKISVSCSKDASVSILTDNKINLSDYNTMYVTATNLAGSGTNAAYFKGWIVVDTDRQRNPYNFGNVPTGFSAITQISKAMTASLDISSLSGEYYVGVGFGVSGSATVSKIWLA